MTIRATVSLYLTVPCNWKNFVIEAGGNVQCSNSCNSLIQHELGSQYCKNCGGTLVPERMRLVTHQWREFCLLEGYRESPMDVFETLEAGRGEIGKLTFLDGPPYRIGVCVGHTNDILSRSEDPTEIPIDVVEKAQAQMERVLPSLNLSGPVQLYLIPSVG